MEEEDKKDLINQLTTKVTTSNKLINTILKVKL